MEIQSGVLESLSPRQGGVIFGTAEDLVTTFGVAVRHVDDLPHGDVVPTLREGVVEVGELYAPVIGFKVQIGDTSVIRPAASMNDIMRLSASSALSDNWRRVWNVTVAFLCNDSEMPYELDGPSSSCTSRSPYCI